MVLAWGNLTGCGMCLDSDFFDLWRSCRDCNIAYSQPECQLSCASCLAGEGVDTAATPAPRADQSLAIPAAGCSVDRRNFQLECRPLSEGTCGVTPAPSTSGVGCQLCPDSDFINDCQGCNVEGCQLRCDSCLSSNRTTGPPAVFTIPDGGCVAGSTGTSGIVCKNGTEGSCPLVPLPPRPVQTESWKIAVSVVGGLLTVLLITTLLYMWWKHWRSNKHLKKKKAVSRMSGDAETREPDRLVHASLIDSNDIQVCKRSNGEDWLLGMGSFGMVYKAKMGKLDVAVKTIHRQHLNPHLTPQQASQVIRTELRILEMLPFDPRIVQLYGSCTKDGNILLVLEYMQGGDLRHVLRSPALVWYKNGAQIALDIINGIRFLHSHNIVHRDIKSGNVLLSEDLRSAKICDVGLARIMGNTSVPGSIHNVKTTFAYAAPEVLMCEKSDQRADIFSYGIVVWELITQERPQRGVLRDFQIPEECPQAVSDMVVSCLKRDPSYRPTAQQIIHVIENSMAESSRRINRDTVTG